MSISIRHQTHKREGNVFKCHRAWRGGVQVQFTFDQSERHTESSSTFILRTQQCFHCSINCTYIFALGGWVGFLDLVFFFDIFQTFTTQKVGDSEQANQLRFR